MLLHSSYFIIVLHADYFFSFLPLCFGAVILYILRRPTLLRICSTIARIFQKSEKRINKIKSVKNAHYIRPNFNVFAAVCWTSGHFLHINFNLVPCDLIRVMGFSFSLFIYFFFCVFARLLPLSLFGCLADFWAGVSSVHRAQPFTLNPFCTRISLSSLPCTALNAQQQQSVFDYMKDDNAICIAEYIFCFFLYLNTFFFHSHFPSIFVFLHSIQSPNRAGWKTAKHQFCFCSRWKIVMFRHCMQIHSMRNNNKIPSIFYDCLMLMNCLSPFMRNLRCGLAKTAAKNNRKSSGHSLMLLMLRVSDE